ncbi:MAG: S46 family peptidase [Thermoanaerobaculia bacterium]|nr:S46 family peptidase [Thermoanaerobaculia bacterium]
MPNPRASLLAMSLLLALPLALPAEDGKWTPSQMLELDPAWLRGLGLELPPSSLWNEDGAGLLDAVVQIDGCSAGFVSAQGLLVTNHHCAFPLLQEHSTPERNLIENGFVAATRGDELGGRATRALVPHSVRDVTAEVEAAVPAGATDAERFRAIDRKLKQLVAACEQTPNRRCRAASYDDGVRYEVVESLEFADVRLVWAPPRAIGEYGGEIDNWSWPRHTGDFTLLRVYASADNQPAAAGAAGNRPFEPRHFFPIAKQGVAPGSFVMVAGYPGATVRSLVADEMVERGGRFHPARAELLARWIAIMEAGAQRDSAAAIALASRIKALANREKNSRGQVAGLARGRIVEKKRAEDEAVLAPLRTAPADHPHRAAVTAYQELAARVAERGKTWTRDFLLEQIPSGSRSLDLALTVVRSALERAKPDLERQSEYMERNLGRLADRLQVEQKRIDPPTELELAVDFFTRLAVLPAGERPAVVASWLAAGGEPAAAVRSRLTEIQAATRVLDGAERAKMLKETEAELRARRDPLLELAFALEPEIRRLDDRRDEDRGAAARLRPTWRRAVAAHLGKPLAPDANGTLRLSFAKVEGYRPRDGMWMEPQTTLAGLVQKHTGEEPFAAPPKLLAVAPEAPASRFADPRLGDVPVAFLASADTTGGNSGSPVVNGRGELVGVNFDRVWENVANDFGYNPEIARNVSVDVRYLLFVLESFGGAEAKGVLAELGVE